MIEQTRLTAEQLEANFADLHPPFSRDEAACEAARCLYCFDAPCTRACPTDIDVPRFIRQILHDDTGSAAETILSENIFGGSCARACPTEVLCEGACVDRTLLQAPVQIGRLQRFATDYAAEHGLRFFAPGPSSGQSVAIVGSGPSGLSCAHMLRRMGHSVDVFEARDVPGGLNTLGIAAYKITTEFSLSEIEPILEMGVDLHLGREIDAAGLTELMTEYDAVYVAVGLGPTRGLGVPGEEIKGVVEALEFIFQTHTGPLSECMVGENVVVLGAGNTAIDVATEAVRLGAQRVTIAYRRTDREMSAFAYEYELARSDGVEFEWLVEPLEFLQTGGHLSGVRMKRLRLDGEGRSATLIPIAGSEFVLACDMAVMALGQAPVLGLLEEVEGLQINSGRLPVNPDSGSTSVDGLFAGGDCTSKGAEIVDAVQEGKRAARGIDAYLRGGQ